MAVGFFNTCVHMLLALQYKAPERMQLIFVTHPQTDFPETQANAEEYEPLVIVKKGGAQPHQKSRVSSPKTVYQMREATDREAQAKNTMNSAQNLVFGS